MRAFLKHLVVPLARFCVRNGIAVQEIEREVRAALVHEAAQAMRNSQLKVNLSRISVMTGLYREEVRKLLENDQVSTDAAKGVIWRVIGLWEQSPRYCTAGGKPRVLTYGSVGCEFEHLVREISSHAGHAAVLTELHRKGLVEKSSKGIKLKSGGDVFSTDAEEAFKLTRDDLDGLIRTVENNLTHDVQQQNLHIRTSYDNIYSEALPEIRRWLFTQGKAFHRKARSFLSKFDQDISPRSNGGPAGAKVSITAFSCMDDHK